MPASLELEARPLGDRLTEVVVSGEVDLGSGRRLRAVLEQALADDGRVLVDLTGCSFMDSSGLSALIHAARSAPDAGRVAIFCPPGGSVRHVFSLTRTQKLLGLHDDRDEALAALAP